MKYICPFLSDLHPCRHLVDLCPPLGAIGFVPGVPSERVREARRLHVYETPPSGREARW